MTAFDPSSAQRRRFAACNGTAPAMSARLRRVCRIHARRQLERLRLRASTCQMICVGVLIACLQRLRAMIRHLAIFWQRRKARQLSTLTHAVKLTELPLVRNWRIGGTVPCRSTARWHGILTVLLLRLLLLRRYISLTPSLIVRLAGYWRHVLWPRATAVAVARDGRKIGKLRNGPWLRPCIITARV